MNQRHSFRIRWLNLILTGSLLLSSFSVTLSIPSKVVQAASATQPRVAIHVSGYTQALDPGSWYTSWHYFVMHDSLEEVLRSDGTPFVLLTDTQIEAGELMDGTTPRYPILFSLASEAISDDEVTHLRDYISAGGFLFSGSSSYTRLANGTARGDFALAIEMGMHISGSPSWHSNQNFTKQQEHRLVNGIPNGSLLWSMIDNHMSTGAGSFPVLNVTLDGINPPVLIANDASGPLITTKKYGLGQIIYHGAFQPLIGIGGYVSDTYSYLIYRNAIEWAFESANLPIIKVSPWPYEYDAALTIRKDFENTPYRILSIEADEELNDSVGAKGDYYICTGTLRAGSPDTQLTEQQKTDGREMLRRAVADHGATIGSHNGGLGIGGDPNAYGYYHWGPDQVEHDFGQTSIQMSYDDIHSWLTGLDNGRAGCGAASNCPNTWASPNFLSALESSRSLLEELGTITLGEQNMGPYPHWSISYEVPDKVFNHITLPTSEWYIGTSVAQSLEYSYGSNHTIETLHNAIDFYYNLGALVNIYGHEPNATGVHHEYPVYSALETEDLEDQCRGYVRLVGATYTGRGHSHLQYDGQYVGCACCSKRRQRPRDCHRGDSSQLRHRSHR